MIERDIFTAALQKRVGPDRSAFLEEACGGDTGLRRQIDALLCEHEQLGSFLEAPAPVPNATLACPGHEWLGTVIGPYKLLEQIGEGGFGLVFMAEQQQPVRRKVAVKVLKPGMDTRQVIVRFEAERQALALMDHPNIAKVLEAGATPGEPGSLGAGRPYVVMELVRGSPITDYCDQNCLTPRERLELFATVCKAVQHAHQKGIIHRDIKPSNVMVTLQDGAPVVKVIDFGIAKALGQQLTDKTLFTAFAQMIGTPLYMSPEQAQGSLDLDTRTDIYSLGLLLYELLTGTTPFDKERLRDAGYDEMRRIIREEEPARPSTRVNTLGRAAKTVSAQRKSDPKRLSQLFRGELDWIVMKALEKDRNRRYETANGLGRDLARYLADQPVEACPPSAYYRLSKLARRNRAMLTTASLVALALVLGTAVSAWQALRATTALNSQGKTLIELGKANEQTRVELAHAEEAEAKANHELFDSLVAQARANRLSRRIGQRFDTLKILHKATGLARDLKLPPERFRDMRNEALAALALTDLRADKEWADDSPGTSLIFAPGLRYYARYDPKGTVYVRSSGDGAELCRLRAPGPGENCLKFSPDGRLLAVLNLELEKAQVWTLAEKENSEISEGSEVAVGKSPAIVFEEKWRGGYGDFCFSPDSREIVLQQPPDLAIAVFDLATQKKTGGLPPVGDDCWLAFNPKARQLALGIARVRVEVRDLVTGKVLWKQPISRDIDSLTWNPDGKTLAVCQSSFRGDVISLWDGASGKPVGNLEGPPGGGGRCVFNHAGSLLASNGWEWILRLWDPLSGRQLFSTFAVPPLDGGPFSPDGRFLAATEYDGKLRIWEVAAGDEYRTLTANPLQSKIAFVSSTVSADGRLLAAGGSGSVGLWDLPSGKNLALIEGSPGINIVLLEPSGALLTMSLNGLFRRQIRREPETGIVHLGAPERLPVPGSPCPIAQSTDGGVLASAQFDGAVVLLADQPNHLVPLGPHADVRGVAVSPDGQLVVTGGFSSGGAKVWKAATGKLEKDLPVGARCGSVFSPDSKRLVTCAGDSVPPQIRIWKVGAWTEVLLKEQPRGWGPAFSPDGKLLVVESGAGVAVLLDPETGKEVARLEDPNQHRARHFTFSPDGTKLVSANSDGNCLHVWDLQALRRRLAAMDLDWD
jgi:eukaryotic-like serine/threonine-protein kinase